MSRKNTIFLLAIVLVALSFWLFNVDYHVSKRDLPTKNCSETDGKILCWSKLLNNTLENEGLPKTFDKLAELYNTEPLFAGGCHTFAHEIGEATYKKFAKGQDFDLNAKTSYCGYGFYHGFMETLLQTTGDIKQAQNFCKYVGLKLNGETVDGEGACYHGIGHGTVDGDDISSWGNAQKMLSPSLKMCEKVAGDDHSQYGKLYRCVSGAYNSLEILSHNPKYKLLKTANDPFSICPTQLKEYQEACYTNMLPAILINTGNDLLKSQNYVEKIKEDGYSIRTSVTSSLFHEFIRMNITLPDYNIEAGIKMCHLLKDPYRMACIDGLSGGHMKYGNPKDAYVKGLSFCSRSTLRDDEKSSCYNYILSRLRIWYSVAKTKEICQSIPEKFQKYCN